MSMLREAPLPNGMPGPVSARRVLACYFALCAPPLAYVALPYAKDSGWFVFLPSLACILTVIILLLFTTWADITNLIQAASGINVIPSRLPLQQKEEP
jgi:hypothetical protein